MYFQVFKKRLWAISLLGAMAAAFAVGCKTKESDDAKTSAAIDIFSQSSKTLVLSLDSSYHGCNDSSTLTLVAPDPTKKDWTGNLGRISGQGMYQCRYQQPIVSIDALYNEELRSDPTDERDVIGYVGHPDWKKSKQQSGPLVNGDPDKLGSQFNFTFDNENPKHKKVDQTTFWTFKGQGKIMYDNLKTSYLLNEVVFAIKMVDEVSYRVEARFVVEQSEDKKLAFIVYGRSFSNKERLDSVGLLK